MAKITIEEHLRRRRAGERRCAAKLDWDLVDTALELVPAQYTELAETGGQPDATAPETDAH